MKKTGLWLGPALLVYAGFSIYLFYPYWSGLAGWSCFLPLNLCLGAAGAFVVSRRWIHASVASFFCGAVYGFSPLALYVTRYHFGAGFVVAIVPWLLVPWGYSRRWIGRHLHSPRPTISVIEIALMMLPFAVIALLFRVMGHYHIFVFPVQTGRMYAVDWLSVVMPLVKARQGHILIGLYHVPLSFLVLGLAMMIKGRRWLPIVVFGVGVALVFWDPLQEVSPLLWLTVPLVLASLWVGLGIQGLAYAGYPDRTWVWVAAVLQVILGFVMLLLSGRFFQYPLWLGHTYARWFVKTGKLYILGSLGFGLVYAGMIRGRSRLIALRQILVCLVLGTDIYFSARYIIDLVF